MELTFEIQYAGVVPLVVNNILKAWTMTFAELTLIFELPPINPITSAELLTFNVVI